MHQDVDDERDVALSVASQYSVQIPLPEPGSKSPAAKKKRYKKKRSARHQRNQFSSIDSVDVGTINYDMFDKQHEKKRGSVFFPIPEERRVNGGIPASQDAPSKKERLFSRLVHTFALFLLLSVV